jgi:phosphodiesterase/alkaline phosphatase D-like protein
VRLLAAIVGVLVLVLLVLAPVAASASVGEGLQPPAWSAKASLAPPLGGGQPPSVTLEPTSLNTGTSAILRASVDPNNSLVSACTFEWGASPALGSSVSCNPSPGSGGNVVLVSGELTGLSTATMYFFRVTATNANGTRTSPVESFTTPHLGPPAANTLQPTGVEATEATLRGSVDANGVQVTACVFEYGTTTAYGSTAPCSPAPGSAGEAVKVAATVSGLLPLTSYHYRIVAENSLGRGTGGDQMLTTPPARAPTLELTAPNPLTSSSATLNGTVNTHGRAASECEFEYGPTPAYGSRAACTPMPGTSTSAVAVSAAIGGLTPLSTYHYRLVAANEGGRSASKDASFSTPSPPPSVTVGEAGSVEPTSATLTGTVNPNGGQVTSCEFEYGVEGTSGSTAPCAVLPGSGTSPVPVSAAIAGLKASTEYRFKLIAKNAGGTSTSQEETFFTGAEAPIVVTEPAAAVGQDWATFAGTDDPNGFAESQCWFEYGTTTSYTGLTECPSLLRAGFSPVAVSATQTGLAPATTYHFRLVAFGEGGEGTGGDETVTTLPAQLATVETQPATSVTGVTATLNAAVNPNLGEVKTCSFEYGTTIKYGNSAACLQPPGRGGSAVATTAWIGGLLEGHTYHYRVVATNPGGTAVGADRTLKTASPKAPRYGQCLEKEKGDYTDANCTHFGEVNGKRVAHVGSYEFKYGAPPACVAQAGGEYTSATCATKAKVAKTGKFEKSTAPRYTVESAHAVYGEVPGYPAVVCTHMQINGELTGPKTGTAVFTFTGCEADGSSCATSGEPWGTMQTKTLDTILVEPKSGEVLTQFVSSAGPSANGIELVCSGLASAHTAGFVAAVTSGDVNVMTNTAALVFAKGKGEQALMTLIIPFGGPYATVFEAEGAATYGAGVEIRP